MTDPISNNNPDRLNWKYEPGQYAIEFAQGKAVIRESDSGSTKSYLPSILDLNGNVLASFPHGLEFETAENFIQANLIEVDKSEDDKSIFHQKLASTLDMSIAFFTGDHRLYHRVRLENIKRWFLGQRRYSDMIQPTTYEWGKHIFEWQQTHNRYTAQTLHGKAVIIETEPVQLSKFSVGKTSRFNLQIEDETGSILNDYFVPEIDFLSAEQRMRTVLSDLESPLVDEAYLYCISFTLQICQHLLPNDTDLMQFVRLQFIDTYLNEVLP